MGRRAAHPEGGREARRAESVRSFRVVLVVTMLALASVTLISVLPARAATGAVGTTGGKGLAPDPTDRLAHPGRSYMPPLPKGVAYDPGRRLPPDPAAAGASRGLRAAKVPATDIWIGAVSCVSTSFCMAVGYLDDYGVSVNYAARWNGSSWSTVRVPQLVALGETRAQSLNGVSCWAPDACMAVGQAAALDDDEVLTEFWNGSSWKLELATVSGLPNNTLYAVSCESNGACMAVGGAGTPVALEWDGSFWTLTTFPSTGDAGDLYGVSCALDVGCVAVGTVSNLADVIVAFYGNAGWVLLSGKSPGSTANILYGVSCVGSSFCMAVGAQRSSGSVTPLWERVSDDSAVAASGTGRDPFSALAVLRGVSCLSSTSCVAVGYGSDEGEPFESTFSETWNGARWSNFASSSPGGSGATDAFYGVSCVGARTCQAAGEQLAGGTLDADWALFEHVSKGAFATLAQPMAYLPYGEVEGVSCPSSSFCMAVGYFEPGYPSIPLVEVWNGKSWGLVTVPSPGGYGSQLYGVSCVSSRSCVLVGGYALDDADYDLYAVAPELLTFNGSSFAIRSIPPDAADTDGILSAVACTSSTSCVAVGASDEAAPFSVEWNGRTTRTTSMLQLGQDYSEPSSVSCVSSSFCVSALLYAGAETYAAIESWNGRRWSINDGEVSATGAANLVLTTVVCRTTTRCVAVGWSGDTPQQPVAVLYNGKRWTAQLFPLPSGAESAGFDGLVCRSSSSCLVVGWAGPKTEPAVYLPLSSFLSGNRWSHLTTFGTSSIILDGAACATSTVCFAVGEAEPQLGNVEATGVEHANGRWTRAFDN